MLRFFVLEDPNAAKRLQRRTSIAVLVVVFAVIVIVFANLLHRAMRGVSRSRQVVVTDILEEPYETDAFLPDGLPDTISPSHYTIQFQHDDNSYNGTVSVSIICHVATRQIVMHAGSALGVSKLIVQDNTGVVFRTIFSRKPSPHDLLVITTDRLLLSETSYNVTIWFLGNLSRIPETFPEMYTPVDRGLLLIEVGRMKALALINEGKALRDVFPCFNYPIYRATFKLSMIGNRGMVAITSKDPFEEDIPGTADALSIIFPQSERIPNSRFTFFYSNFWSVSNSDPVRVWSYKSTEDMSTSTALATSVYQYLQKDYPKWPLPEQIHIVGLPGHVTPACNWGVIYFKDEDLRITASDSLEKKANLGFILVRCLTRTWWGSVVSTVWWRDEWIFYGLCTYMAIAIVSNRIQGTDFHASVFAARLVAMTAESNGHLSHVANDAKLPYFSDVYLWEEARQAWATSVFHTYALFVGYSTFTWEQGMFIEEHQFSAVTAAQFVAQFGSDRIVTQEFFQSWTSTPGIPLLRVGKYADGGVTVEQERFCVTHPSCASAGEHVWRVPIFARVYNESFLSHATAAVHMQRKTQVIELGSPFMFIYLYPKTAIYSRIMYCVDNWVKIADVLAERKLSYFPPVNRATFLDDLAAFVRSGLLDMPFFLSFLRYLPHETSPIVWNVYRTAYAAFLAEGKEQDVKLLKDFHERLCGELRDDFKQLVRCVSAI
ncbi:leucyl-cystinyl aminopeptidase-like [Ornithodoros turicata]|uniref:leucyl-cystinyl aminopeptidase-like n=1 Tax=Ornithodoros turicata TaxID=34597 RepID=UPI00313996B8